LRLLAAAFEAARRAATDLHLQPGESGRQALIIRRKREQLECEYRATRGLEGRG
jgi:hypothetical protein